MKIPSDHDTEMNKPTELTLIRHGEPHLAGCLLGSTDSKLTDLGWRQLNETFCTLGVADVLVSSPLLRCADFATQWSVQGKNSLCPRNFLTMAAFREVDFGEWDGQTFEQIARHSPDQLSAYYHDPAQVTPPGGETLQAFSLRVEEAICETLEEYSGKRIHLLCHAGVIRTIIAWALEIPYESCIHVFRLAIDYASVTRIMVYQNNNEWVPQIVLMNSRPGPSVAAPGAPE